MTELRRSLLAKIADHAHAQQAAGLVDQLAQHRNPVTNRESRRFIEATGYVTFAEIS